jgi:hypothetical protein
VTEPKPSRRLAALQEGARVGPQKPQTKKAHLAVSLSRQTMVPAPGIEPGTY